MGRSKELTEERSYVGLSISKIAAETKTTGNNCNYPKKISDTWNIQTAPRSGRPPITTSREERILARLVKEGRRATAKVLTRRWNEVTQKKVSEMTTTVRTMVLVL